jgi:type VI secretion system protein ImpA
MPSAFVYPYQDLLQPIAGADPAGEEPKPHRTALQSRLAAATGNSGGGSSGGGGRLPDDPADFIIFVLKNKSKDLELACRLTPLWTDRKGLPGLLTSLAFLADFVSVCWGRLYPKIEDPGDEEIIVGRLKWLCSVGSTRVLADSARLIPLFGQLTFDEVQKIVKESGTEYKEVLKKDLQLSAVTNYAGIETDLSQCLGDLQRLNDDLTQRLGRDSEQRDYWSQSYLEPLQQWLQSSLEMTRQLNRIFFPDSASASGPGPVPQAAIEPENSAKSETESMNAGGGELTRDSILQSILQLAETFGKIEPHSPIPFLIQHAVSLGNMDFPTMILDLFQNDPNVKQKLEMMRILKAAND